MERHIDNVSRGGPVVEMLGSDTARIAELERKLAAVVGRLEHMEGMLFSDRYRPDTIALSEILGAVAAVFGVEIHDIRSRRRHRVAARPRQAFCYFAKVYSFATLTEIGEFINRDRTTVMHAISTILNLIETDRHVAEDINSVREILDEAKRDHLENYTGRRYA